MLIISDLCNKVLWVVNVTSKNKLRSFTKNISYTISANVISLIISALTVLVVPKFIGVDEYGYYQLYLFYIPYVTILCFGWGEGIYLRIGGQYYQNINKHMYFAQFWLCAIFEVLIYSIILVFALFNLTDANELFVVICTCISAIPICLIVFLTYILQATARIKEYAIVTVFEKLSMTVFVVTLIIFGYHNYNLILVSNICALTISLSVAIFFCRDIVFNKKFLPIKSVISDIYLNVTAGLKLMFSALSARLIVGIVRFFIQRQWDIATFGKVSLTLNLSNMLTTTVNAIAVVVYPMLRRAKNNQLPVIYGVIRIILMGVVFGGLVFYYPMQLILSAWLPQYAESIRYAAILLPICAYESKMAMLINTYFKTLRLEKMLMISNLAALAVSVVCAVLSIMVFENVTLAIISILIALMFRGIFSELVLSRHIDVSVKKDIVIELAMTIAFIICNWYLGLVGMGIYALCYVFYLVIKKNDIKQTIKYIKDMR